MIKHILVIAGGSGSGKSTLAYALQDKYPEKIEVLHFDDYMKSSENVPVLHGMPNRDHPDAIDFEKLFRDLTFLKRGQPLEVMTRDEKINPGYMKGQGKAPIIIHPKELLIVEGYLALYDKRMTDLMNYGIFLDLSHEFRAKRRTKPQSSEYVEKILLPMHNKYLEPTKQNADLVIDVQSLSLSELKEIVVDKLKKQGIL